MYTGSSQVVIAGVTGDKVNGVLTIGTPSASSTPNDGTYNLSGDGLDVGNGSGANIKVVVTNSGTDIVATITDPGSGYSTSDTLTYSNFDGGSSDLTLAIDSVGDTLGGIPVSAINSSYTGSGTNLSNIDIDSFTVTPDLTSFDLDSSYTANDNVLGGGEYAMRVWLDPEKMAKLITSKYPNHQFGWKVLGAVFAHFNKLEDSLNANIKALRINDRDPEAYNNLGNILLKFGSLLPINCE